MPEPIRMSFEVGCSRTHAFDTWTARISTWWPRSHTVSADPDAAVVLERRRGGRIFERTSRGEEHDWGEVTAFDRPRSLKYLWHIRSDRADATEVEISFHELGRDRTRVEIEHRGWERLGSRGAAWRDVNRGGWDGVLPSYQAACASPSCGG